MTKTQALHSFFGGFGIPAFEENSVPSFDEDKTFPFLTYTVVTDSFDHEVAITANLWYKSTSWTACNLKLNEISNAIGYGGKIIDFDDGKIWIKPGSPFAQSMGDSDDKLIKRKYINLTVEFFSAT